MTDCGKNWKIFILAHQKIYDEMYENDKHFNNKNYQVINVNTKRNVELENSEKYSVITQTNFKNFEELGSNYAESEAIWNLWKEGLHKNLDYIGFIHYDVNTTTTDKSLTDEISSYIKDKTSAHIAFLEFSPKEEWEKWDNRNLIQPLKNGEKIGYYQYILDDYNNYFKTTYTKKDFIKRNKINLCSCFFIDVKTFDKMMHFFDFALKNGRLNAFDITNDVRLPGGLAERYFGLFLLFEYDDTRSIPLSHGGVTTRKYYPEANQAKIENSKSFGFYLKYKTIILLLKLLKSITLIKKSREKLKEKIRKIKEKISYADS